ncbi:MAG TPA: hypothetical protein VHW69_14080 [Rhizomicrobium sp.]|nr:hypothetical protein [Rhizomicrobium sp.]
MASVKLGLVAVLLLSSAVARADVEISNKPTQNMSCNAGVCTATAQKAVLNVGDLATMLAGGDATVKTGSVAKDIDVGQPLSWTSTARLTLDAQQSVQIEKQVTVTGQGALTVTTNDSGAKAKNKTGEFVIVPEHGSVQFWDLASSLIIDGNSYMLVGDIKTLASDIAANPSGFYALAKPYDASADGIYTSSPTQVVFQGVFEGMGNGISKFSMNSDAASSTGLFAMVGDGGSVRDLAIVNALLDSKGTQQVGLLAELNYGQIVRCWVTGNIHFSRAAYDVGGLVAGNLGTITNSHVDMRLSGSAGNFYTFANVGGLVAANGGTITSSYALGSVAYRHTDRSDMGGLVGENFGIIENTYSLNRVKSGRKTTDSNNFGGLLGVLDSAGSVSSSYAAGEIEVDQAASPGGLIGWYADGHIKNTYWNLDGGISDPAQGAGNEKNVGGITGLTTQQLQSGLPDGFDPKTWGQAPNINNGYPYLLANPPR